MALECLLDKEKERPKCHGEDHCLGQEDISVHHAQALAQKTNDQVVHQEREKAGVRKVTEKEGVDISLVESVRTKGEVVHVGKHVVPGPHHVQTIQQRVHSNHRKTDISIR